MLDRSFLKSYNTTLSRSHPLTLRGSALSAFVLYGALAIAQNSFAAEAKTETTAQAKPKPVPVPSLIFPQGYFDAIRLKKNLPLRWNLWDESQGKNISFIVDGDNRYLRVTNPNPAKSVGVMTRLKLSPQWKRLFVTSQLAVRNLVPGREPWQTARVVLSFEDKNQKMVGDYQPALLLPGNSSWKAVNARLIIPPGAMYLKVEPCFMGASGVMDIDDINIELDTAGGLLPQGAFDTWPHEENLPKDWKYWTQDEVAKVKLWKNNGNRWLTLTNTDQTKSVGLVTRLTLDPAWKKLLVETHLSAQALKLGSAFWQTGRVVFHFEDSEHNAIGGYQPSLDIKTQGNSPWKAVKALLTVPDGAAYLKIEPGLYNATGTLAVDDITISAPPDKETPKVAPKTDTGDKKSGTQTIAQEKPNTEERAN